MAWLSPHIYNHDERRVGLEWKCPIRDGFCWVPFKTWPIREPRWNWDGNRERPTVTPSIHCIACGFHANLVEGQFQPTPDSKQKP